MFVLFLNEKNFTDSTAWNTGETGDMDYMLRLNMNGWQKIRREYSYHSLGNYCIFKENAESLSSLKNVALTFVS